MPKIDAAFVVDIIIGGHVICPDHVVDAFTGSADGRDDVIAGFEIVNVGTDLFDDAKAIVTSISRN